MKSWAFESCQPDISKSICVRGLKFGQLLGDDEQITWLAFEQIPKKFVEFWHVSNLAIFRGKHMLGHSVLQTLALVY